MAFADWAQTKRTHLEPGGLFVVILRLSKPFPLSMQDGYDMAPAEMTDIPIRVAVSMGSLGTQSPRISEDRQWIYFPYFYRDIAHGIDTLQSLTLLYWQEKYPDYPASLVGTWEQRDDGLPTYASGGDDLPGGGIPVDVEPTEEPEPKAKPPQDSVLPGPGLGGVGLDLSFLGWGLQLLLVLLFLSFAFGYAGGSR